MLFRPLILMPLLLLAACVATSTRDRPFTDDWSDYRRGQDNTDRRVPRETEEAEERRIGPATVRYDEEGRPRVNLGGDEGLGADVRVSAGGSARLRYRRHWNFVRPDRRR